MKNKFRAKRFGWLIALATLFVGIVVIATLLARGTEQVTKADDTMTQIGYLYCYTNSPTDAFFEARSQLNAKHEIKYTFSEQGSDKASYTYTGSFETPEYAEMGMADLHADYNTYMGKAGIYQESLYPTWNVIGNNAVINLFIDKEHFNAYTAKFLFISNEEFSAQKLDDIANLEQFYKTRGFSCKSSQ